MKIGPVSAGVEPSRARANLCAAKIGMFHLKARRAGKDNGEMTADFAHLDALRSSLSHESARLAAARKPDEIATRKVLVAQIEREIASLATRGIVEPVDEAITTRRASSSSLNQQSQRLRRRKSKKRLAEYRSKRGRANNYLARENNT